LYCAVIVLYCGGDCIGLLPSAGANQFGVWRGGLRLVVVLQNLGELGCDSVPCSSSPVLNIFLDTLHPTFHVSMVGDCEPMRFSHTTIAPTGHLKGAFPVKVFLKEIRREKGNSRL
jgi:hypothetical protein